MRTRVKVKKQTIKQNKQSEIQNKSTNVASSIKIKEEEELMPIKLKKSTHKQKQTNLSDLDSFSLESISSSVASLVSTTQNSNNEALIVENDCVERKISEELIEENTLDDGDWIQVKKPSRSNIIQTNQKLSNESILNNKSKSNGQFLVFVFFI